jgi:hypothetical protein
MQEFHSGNEFVKGAPCDSAIRATEELSQVNREL